MIGCRRSRWRLVGCRLPPLKSEQYHANNTLNVSSRRGMMGWRAFCLTPLTKGREVKRLERQHPKGVYLPQSFSVVNPNLEAHPKADRSRTCFLCWWNEIEGQVASSGDNFASPLHIIKGLWGRPWSLFRRDWPARATPDQSEQLSGVTDLYFIPCFTCALGKLGNTLLHD